MDGPRQKCSFSPLQRSGPEPNSPILGLLGILGSEKEDRGSTRLCSRSSWRHPRRPNGYLSRWPHAASTTCQGPMPPRRPRPEDEKCCFEVHHFSIIPIQMGLLSQAIFGNDLGNNHASFIYIMEQPPWHPRSPPCRPQGFGQDIPSFWGHVPRCHVELLKPAQGIWMLKANKGGGRS